MDYSLDRLFEYTGIDIVDKVSYEVYMLIRAIGNHEYSDYDGLKLLVKNIINLEPDKVSMIVDSLVDLELRPMEKNNALASIGYNKRLHDFCSIVCALNDSGYKFNSENFNEKMFKIRGNLIIKNSSRLDIMIANPIKFSYEKNDESVSFNKYLKSDELIDGLELCNLMLYIGTNNYKNSFDVLKRGKFVKTKEMVKILK